MLDKKYTRIIGVFLALFLIFSFLSPMLVYADVTESTGKTITHADSSIKGDAIGKAMNGGGETAKSEFESGKVKYTGNTLIVETKGEKHELLTVGDNAIYVNPQAFKDAKQSDVTKAMRIFTDAMTDLSNSSDTVQQIMSDMQDVDSSVSSIMLPLIFESTKGDMYQAYKITSPFLNVLSIVLGVGAVILILLLLFSTVMDLAYIGLPVWREAQAGKDGGKNPFGVSYEALTTVKEIEKGLGGGDGGYRNAYLLYFRRRALTYIILAICIMYLICGGLSGIIGFVLSLVSGITG